MALEYADKKERLNEGFAALIELNRKFPAHQVHEAETQLYLETLASLRPDAKPKSAEFSLLVAAQEREINSGDRAFSGNELRLKVEIPMLAYLYVILTDSSGSSFFLYPTPSNNENPVQGHVEIPGAEAEALVLDDNRGKERILVFVQTQPSPVIQSLLERAHAGGLSAFSSEILARNARARMPLTKKKSPGSFSSPFGHAGVLFEINHR